MKLAAILKMFYHFHPRLLTFSFCLEPSLSFFDRLLDDFLLLRALLVAGVTGSEAAAGEGTFSSALIFFAEALAFLDFERFLAFVVFWK